MRTAFLCAMMTVSAIAKAAMVDPAIDDPDKEWCYLAKSTVCIGVPYMPEVIQVTYDGAIYTRNAELCFFYGEKHTPVMARQKTFLDGWIPIVQYNWTDKNIAYSIEMFSFILDGETEENTVQFVRLSAENAGDQAATAVHRMRGQAFGDRDLAHFHLSGSSPERYREYRTKHKEL